MQRLKLRPYIDAAPTWPDRGRVILAQYDRETIVLYLACSRGLAQYAVDHGHLGSSELRTDRMTWLRPGYLSVMRQSGWATESGAKAVLALWVARDAFDAVLGRAVLSRYPERGIYETRAVWQEALDASEVRAQWDPDFPPRGPKLERRVLLLGLRGDALLGLVTEHLRYVEDITDFAHQQARFVATPEMLFVPAQDIYPVRDGAVVRRLDLDKSVPD